MAKAEAPRMKGIVVQRETTAPQEVNIRNYVDLLWVVGAGVLGVSLLCVTAGIALTSPNTSAVLQPQSIIELAVANVNTAAALTMEAFPQHLITPTVVASNTLAPSAISFSPTVTSLPPTIIASATFIPMTSTRRPGQGSNSSSNPNPTSTLTSVPTQTSSPLPPPTLTSSPIPPPTLTSSPIPPPTITNTPKATKTPKPTRTRTPVPPPTDTSAPLPTNTSPPPTDTQAPPPTDTSAPPPTDTSAPPPTDTSAPAAPTDTPSVP